MSGVKMLPYGIPNFEKLRRQNMYCVDKSMYIPKMEAAGNFLFLIRPRRFGKSIFLSMLRYYYDMSLQNKFDELFGGLWIHEHPTAEKGQYQVIYFDFSQATIGEGELEPLFHRYCSDRLINFAKRNKAYYDDDFLDEVKKRAPDSAAQLSYIADEARDKGHLLYLIVDEYDNFTNNVLSEKGHAVYHALTHASGFYREVFKLYKSNFDRILMMGVSPVTMDDLTSGYNISSNISTDPEFNMMLGFSETDVRQMIDYYRENGMITADTDTLIAEMKPWYDNYCFAEESIGKDPKVFNCDMVIYYLRNYIREGKAPKQMLDPNTRTDYKKIKKLIELDRITAHEKSLIHQIAADKQIVANINTSFPAERIFDEGNFVSLLYYYGMLTIAGTHEGRLVLIIPNNNVRKQYYDYILEDYQAEVNMNMFRLDEAMADMAYRGTWRTSLQMIADAYKNSTSVRDAIQGERHVQGFFTAYLNFTNFYLTAPEVELNHGYCDFFLMPDRIRYKDVLHSYIIELKYLSASASENDAKNQWDDAVVQIREYGKGRKVSLMCQETELHLIILQIKEHELLRMEEIKNSCEDKKLK